MLELHAIATPLRWDWWWETGRNEYGFPMYKARRRVFEARCSSTEARVCDYPTDVHYRRKSWWSGLTECTGGEVRECAVEVPCIARLDHCQKYVGRKDVGVGNCAILSMETLV